MKIIITESQYKRILLQEESSSFKKGQELKGSQWLYDFIRHEEGHPKKKGEPVLKSYKAPGDVWTIGYGHTSGDIEPAVKPNMSITKDQANKIMYNDLTSSADCIRRIFNQWESKGIKVVITQDMFDVLVSLAFNTGCSSVRQSKFIQSLKKKKYKQAAEEIKTYNLEAGFSGLNSRRQKESEKFLTGISV